MLGVSRRDVLRGQIGVRSWGEVARMEKQKP